MTEEQLKDTLIQLKNEDIDWDEVNVDTIVDEIIRHTQTTDMELKEGLAEPLMEKIIEENLISEQSMEALAKRCIDETHLFLEIGDVETRNKMVRSFSIYIVKLLLKKDREDAYISNDLYNKIRNQVLLYLDLEQDYRMYTADMGFVNSILYSIQAVYEMINNKRMDHQYYTELFQALLNKIFTYQTLYQYDEEQYTIEAIRSLMQNGFSETKLIDFFARVPQFLAKQKEKLDRHQYWNLYKNCKMLLQGIYVKLDIDNERPLLLTEVKKCLNTI